MKFCTDCGYHLVADTSRGNLVFNCDNCKKQFSSNVTDTLMMEINYEAKESSERYHVFEQNAPFDPAGKKIAIPCEKCKHPYMTHIYIGEKFSSKYICECGHSTSSVVKK